MEDRRAKESSVTHFQRRSVVCWVLRTSSSSIKHGHKVDAMLRWRRFRLWISLAAVWLPSLVIAERHRCSSSRKTSRESNPSPFGFGDGLAPDLDEFCRSPSQSARPIPRGCQPAEAAAGTEATAEGLDEVQGVAMLPEVRSPRPGLRYKSCHAISAPPPLRPASAPFRWAGTGSRKLVGYAEPPRPGMTAAAGPLAAYPVPAN